MKEKTMETILINREKKESTIDLVRKFPKLS